MGSLILISGANGSGKSLYAERLAARAEGSRCYVATMRPCTDDNLRRIERHRAQRQGLGFQTLECPCQVGDAHVPEDSVVLLEDVSNLLANVVFETGGSADSVFQDICILLDRCALLIAVTISGLERGGCDGETATYIDSLNQLNRRLFDRADTAVELRNQLPVCRKGDIHAYI